MDLKIMGSGSATGGIYENIKIMGSGDINGDVECISYSVMGSGDLHGNLKAQFVKISGSGDVSGDVDAEDIIINGSGDLKSNVRCNMLKINGSGDVFGNVKAEEVIISGASDIKEDCECEKFVGKGSFDIGGLLNSEYVEVSVISNCNVREIGASKVSVLKGESLIFGLFKKKLNVDDKKLRCDIIEANEIYLENTVAKVVRGESVIIGEGCEIERLEYKEKCEVNPKSKVGYIDKTTQEKNDLMLK